MSDESDSPEREEFDHAPIEHMDIWGGMSVNELVSEYGKAGIGAETIHKAVDIYTTMLTDDSVTNFFGLAGAMVPSGMRQIVCELIADGHIDALVTTGANLTHDTIEAIGGKHHHGRERGDNTLREHDEQLRDEQVDRIYNVYLPQEHFTLMEEHLRANVFSQIEESVSIQEFIAELGRANAEQNQERGIDKDPGIAATAYQHDVPIYA
ncbi:MAG: deoxyhypusine synthase family protein, partial [Halobacteriaceae archaeon]